MQELKVLRERAGYPSWSALRARASGVSRTTIRRAVNGERAPHRAERRAARECPASPRRCARSASSPRHAQRGTREPRRAPRRAGAWARRRSALDAVERDPKLAARVRALVAPLEHAGPAASPLAFLTSRSVRGHRTAHPRQAPLARTTQHRHWEAPAHSRVAQADSLARGASRQGMDDDVARPQRRGSRHRTRRYGKRPEAFRVTKKRKPPGYLGKLLALGESLRPGTVTHLVIRHDSWCPRLKDPPGECSCDADIDPPKGAS